MTNQKTNDLADLIQDLRRLHNETTPGEWVKGMTSHHTVSAREGRDPYRVAEFRHAADASFCDAAHKHLPMLLDAFAPQEASGAPLTDDGRFLNWLADRLVFVYGEKMGVDFVLATRRIAGSLVTPAPVAPARRLVLTTHQGELLAVTWQDDDHQILEIVWQKPQAMLQDEDRRLSRALAGKPHARAHAEEAAAAIRDGAPSPGTVRFDIPVDDCFRITNHDCPRMECMDCNADADISSEIQHEPGCRVAALATGPLAGDIVATIGGTLHEYKVLNVVGDQVQVERMDGSAQHIAIAFRADQLVIRQRAAAETK